MKALPFGAQNSSTNPPRRTHLYCSINWDTNLQRKIYLVHLAANSNIKALKRDHLCHQRNWSIKAPRRRALVPCCSRNSNTRTQTGHMTREEDHVTEGIPHSCSTCFYAPTPQRHPTMVSTQPCHYCYFQRSVSVKFLMGSLWIIFTDRGGCIGREGDQLLDRGPTSKW